MVGKNATSRFFSSTNASTSSNGSCPFSDPQLTASWLSSTPLSAIPSSFAFEFWMRLLLISNDSVPLLLAKTIHFKNSYKQIHHLALPGVTLTYCKPCVLGLWIATLLVTLTLALDAKRKGLSRIPPFSSTRGPLVTHYPDIHLLSSQSSSSFRRWSAQGYNKQP